MGHLSVVNLLMKDKRVDVNATDYEVKTPLWWVCREGDIKMVRIMLASERTFDVKKSSAINPSGFNASQIARRDRFLEIGKLVEEYGHNPERIRFRIRRKLAWDGFLFLPFIFFFLSLASDSHNYNQSINQSKSQQTNKQTNSGDLCHGHSFL